MKRISLTQNMYATVDDIDYEKISKHVWYARKNQTGNWYAATTVRVNRQRKQVHMHKFILGITGRYPLVDHADRDGLNNRRYNLRISSHQQNTRHSIKRRGDYTSRFKGVSWDKSKRRWVMGISIDKRKIYRKSFKDEIEAARSYNKIATEIFGKYAVLNNI